MKKEQVILTMLTAPDRNKAVVKNYSINVVKMSVQINHISRLKTCTFI